MDVGELACIDSNNSFTNVSSKNISLPFCASGRGLSLVLGGFGRLRSMSNLT